MNTLTDYFKALNITTPSPTFACLRSIIEGHLSTFPFTSIPVLLSEELPLELPAIIERLVGKGRGGYCFEHNKLLYSALERIGWKVTPLLARIILGRENIPPKTHRITILELDGESYLVDVGNSYFSPPMPVKLDGTEVTSKSGKTFRISRDASDTYALELVLTDEIFTIYTFRFQPCFEADFELSHFYSHKHPKATFVNNLVLSKVFPDEIRSLQNNIYYRMFSQNTVETVITDISVFSSIIKIDFKYPATDNEIEFLFNLCHHQS